MVRSIRVGDELRKCGFSDQYAVEIAKTIGIRLNDECFAQPLYGDMRGFINRNGALVIMELSIEKDHDNVYCDVSIDDFVAVPWGHFHDDVLDNKQIDSTAISILKEIKKRIKIDESLNNSRKRPVS